MSAPRISKEAAAEALRFMAARAWDRYCEIMGGLACEEVLAERAEPYLQIHQLLVSKASDLLSGRPALS